MYKKTTLLSKFKKTQATLQNYSSLHIKILNNLNLVVNTIQIYIF